MLKSKAIELLGGSIAAAAAEIGITYQAVDKWPAMLPGRIEDRVLAALARKRGLVEELSTPAGPSAASVAPGQSSSATAPLQEGAHV